MAYYPRTPHMATPRLAPQPPPVVYTTVTTAPYQSPGPHHPGHKLYHVAASEPPYARGRHRSSSRSRNHKRSHSSGGGHHHHRRHRSSTPSRSIPSHYSPAAQYASIPSTRHRRNSHSVSNHHRSSSIRDPRRSAHYNHQYHHMSHRGESIGERIKRFFGIGTHKVRFVDHHGHEVDRVGRPIYAY